MISRCAVLALLVACGDKDDDDDDDDNDDDDYHTGDFYVTARIDGADYVGNSQGLTWLGEQEGVGWTLVWPADRLSGSLLSWQPGETGTLDLYYAEDMEIEESDGYLTYMDEGGGYYATTSGSFTIEAWESNNDDPILGYAWGSFEGTAEGVMGTTGSVSITDGEFFSIVTDSSKTGE